MVQYIFNMFFCLLAAAAIGFFVAWFLRRLRILELEDDISSTKRALTDREARANLAARRADEFQSELTTAQQSLTLSESELKTAGQRAQESLEHSARLNADITTKDAALASLTAIVTLREASAKTRDAKLSEIEGVALKRSQEIDTLRGQLARAQSAVESTTQNKDIEIARLKTSLLQREGETKTRDADMVRLTAQLAPLLALPSLTAKKDDELARSNRLLSENQKQIDQLRADLSHAKPRADQSAADLRAKTEAFTQLTREYEAVSKTLTSRTASLSDVQEQLRKAQAALQANEEQSASGKGSQLAAATQPIAPVSAPMPTSVSSSKSVSTAPYPRQISGTPSHRDDIKHIYGVGPSLEITLNKLGVYYFKQVAVWSDSDIEFFDSKLPEFHGRIKRENWVRSAVEEHYKKYGEWLAQGTPIMTMPETNRT